MTNSKNFILKLVKSFTVGSLKDSERGEDLEKIAAQEQKQFRFDTLVAATGNFHPSHKLGEGGFGPVFKGKLDDGREIAVKKLSQSSKQGMKEFKNEAKLLARVQHRNIVDLLGYCVHGEDKLLVYEYVSNESLDKLLFKSNRREVLDWNRRYEIINGIARGLLYLHEDSNKVIIHRDIKASNILLDDRWVPKIADFGMARLFPGDQTHVNTHIAGTNGYMAPEYLIYGHLSVLADVFSFGVLVLEIISGRKNSLFNSFARADNLLEWAYKLYKRGRIKEIVDTALAESTMPEEQVARCIHIGLLCVQVNPALRPTMRRVVVMLSRKSKILDEPTIPRYKLNRKHGEQSETSSESHSNSTNKSSTFSVNGSAPEQASISASTQASTQASTSKTTSKTTYVSALPSISSDSVVDSRGKQPAES